MVNLVKARQKAKKSGAPPKQDKLERFKSEAGQRRAAPTDESGPRRSESGLLELLTFTIGGEQYAIEVERVVEIATPRPLTRVPNADPFIRGVISLRGTVVTIVDVRGRLRHPPDGEDQQVIVVTDRGGAIGFHVDRVLRPVKIAPDAIAPHPVVHASEERPAIRGVFRQQNGLTILLDLEKLVA